jgi:hypothetical protein
MKLSLIAALLLALTFCGCRAPATADAPGGAPQRRSLLAEGETLLYSHPVAGTTSNSPLSTLNWGAQWFALPPGTSVDITRVRIRLGRTTTGTGKKLFAQICRATADHKLTSPILPYGNETVQVSLDAVGATVDWVEIPFAYATGIDPANGAVFVIGQKVPGTFGAYTQIQRDGTAPDGGHFMASATSGTGWTSPADAKDLYVEVYGTVAP